MPRPPKPCLICGKPTQNTRCPLHTHTGKAAKHQDRERPGHRKEHAQARKHWQPFVQTGNWPCSRCGERILPHQTWDVDQRPWGMEPSHSSCNRSAGGRHEP